MRVPLSWLRAYAPIPETVTSREISEALIGQGLEVETVDSDGADITGPLVIGRVEEFTEETHSNGKTIRWCRVDVGVHNTGGTSTDPRSTSSGQRSAEPGRGIVCGALNFT